MSRPSKLSPSLSHSYDLTGKKFRLHSEIGGRVGSGNALWFTNSFRGIMIRRRPLAVCDHKERRLMTRLSSSEGVDIRTACARQQEGHFRARSRSKVVAGAAMPRRPK